MLRKFDPCQWFRVSDFTNLGKFGHVGKLGLDQQQISVIVAKVLVAVPVTVLLLLVVVVLVYLAHSLRETQESQEL